MSDDKALAEVETIKHHHRQHVSDNFPAPGICVSRCTDKWPCEAYRSAAALDAALRHHQPRQLYQMLTGAPAAPACEHGEDYDGDAHFEADDSYWYCRDKPTIKVCISCTDESDGDLWAEWPCPTYSDISAALLGRRSLVPDIDLAAMLAAIRENAEGLTATHADEDCRPGHACTGHEAIWMADALKAVLKLAADTREVRDYSGYETDGRLAGWDLSPAKLREAITTALSGEAKTSG